MCECVFCEILKGSLPANVIYDDKYLQIILDIEPINEGHLLVLPKIHTDSIDKLPDEMLFAITKATKKCVQALKKCYLADGYSIMQNGGKFCDFGHCHMHVFPRYKGDGFGWTYGNSHQVNVQIAEKIKEAMKAVESEMSE